MGLRVSPTEGTGGARNRAKEQPEWHCQNKIDAAVYEVGCDPPPESPGDVGSWCVQVDSLSVWGRRLIHCILGCMSLFHSIALWCLMVEGLVTVLREKQQGGELIQAFGSHLRHILADHLFPFMTGQLGMWLWLG